MTLYVHPYAPVLLFSIAVVHGFCSQPCMFHRSESALTFTRFCLHNSYFSVRPDSSLWDFGSSFLYVWFVCITSVVTTEQTTRAVVPLIRWGAVSRASGNRIQPSAPPMGSGRVGIKQEPATITRQSIRPSPLYPFSLPSSFARSLFSRTPSHHERLPHPQRRLPAQLPATARSQMRLLLWKRLEQFVQFG